MRGNVFFAAIDHVAEHDHGVLSGDWLRGRGRIHDHDKARS